MYLSNIKLYISVTCPLNWIPIQNSCYKLSSSGLAWSEAKNACELEALGANLAVVNSPAEQRALAPEISKINQKTWIGLHRHPTDTSKWLWIDGSRTKYTHWKNGKPDNSGGIDDCVEIDPNIGEWSDARCSRPHHYACEISGRSRNIIKSRWIIIRIIAFPCSIFKPIEN